VKGILLRTDEVRAMLDGRKTQTRRPITPQPEFAQEYWYQGKKLYECVERTWCYKNHVSPDPWNEIGWIAQFAPYQPGDIIYVRETYFRDDCTPDCSGQKDENECPFSRVGDSCYGYKAQYANPDGVDIKWRPSIHMPKEAARIFLRVTDVQVERVQEITEEDARAEGIQSYWAEPHRDVPPFIGAAKEIGADLCSTRREAFGQLWNSLYAAKGYGWDVNPWVWKYTFERTEKPNV
jgi:hypothetical protein